MKKWLCALALVAGVCASVMLLSRPVSKPLPTETEKVRSFDGAPVLYLNESMTTYTAAYTSVDGEEDPKDLNSPIPMKDRVFNQTGVQCVWASIEMLGRWAEEPKLTNPPLTSRSECKSYSSPSRAAAELEKLQVKFEQTYNDREAGLKLIRKAMAEGRGCLWGVPGHAMVIVHFDESKDIMKWVDDSDRTLKVQSMNIEKFKKRWDSWVLVIYADKDIVPMKMGRNNLPQSIPIIDRNNPQGKYPKDYIPVPKKP